MLESMGFYTGIDLAKLIAARAILHEGLPEEELHGNVPKAGIPQKTLKIPLTQFRSIHADWIVTNIKYTPDLSLPQSTDDLFNAPSLIAESKKISVGNATAIVPQRLTLGAGAGRFCRQL